MQPPPVPLQGVRDEGVMRKGPGAIYDLYQYHLAQELGETFDGLKELQKLVSVLPTTNPYVGFGESAPVDGTYEDNANEAVNRRVEVLFFEYGHEPDVATLDEDPHISELYDQQVFTREPLTGLSARPSKVHLVLVLESPRGVALANSAYELVAGATTIAGTTDANGTLREILPKEATRATLKVIPAEDLRQAGLAQCREGETPDCAAETYQWELSLGTPPTEDLEGHQWRLRNMGYDPGLIIGELDDRTECAIAAFQEELGIRDEAGLGAKTRARLVDRFGC